MVSCFFIGLLQLGSIIPLVKYTQLIVVFLIIFSVSVISNSRLH